MSSVVRAVWSICEKEKKGPCFPFVFEKSILLDTYFQYLEDVL